MQQMRILLLIILFGCSAKATAQDPQLLNVDWYLHTLTIDGTSFTPPSNSEVMNVFAIFNNLDQFETYVCNNMSGLLSYSGNNFTFLGWGITLLECKMAVNYDFEQLYAWNFFIDHIESPFQYEIINEPNGSKSLIITNIIGDTAIYNTEVLSINSPLSPKLSVYPNPTTGVLFLSFQEEIEIQSISLYDSKGILIHYLQQPDRDSTIDISNLKSGLYILKVISKNGEIQLNKVVKQ